CGGRQLLRSTRHAGCRDSRGSPARASEVRAQDSQGLPCAVPAPIEPPALASGFLRSQPARRLQPARDHYLTDSTTDSFRSPAGFATQRIFCASYAFQLLSTLKQRSGEVNRKTT